MLIAHTERQKVTRKIKKAKKNDDAEALLDARVDLNYILVRLLVLIFEVLEAENYTTTALSQTEEIHISLSPGSSRSGFGFQVYDIF